jgi:hypothetical protein
MSPSVAAADLASLRRSVEAVNDINQIIERYQRFISAAKDPKVLCSPMHRTIWPPGRSVATTAW